MSITRHQASGAYPRWTPPAFDAPPEEPEESPEHLPASAVDEAAVAEEAESAPPEPTEPPIKLPTAEEIEAIFEQSRQDGERTGYEEGRTRAEEEMRAELRGQSARIAELIRSMDSALDQLGGDVAEEIVTLSIALARQMVGESLQARPEAVLATVQDALLQIPQGAVRVFLHPQDLALVREHLEDPLDGSRHQLLEDPDMERGGCRLEAAGCDIDATLATRWQRVLAGIGRPDDGPQDDA